MMAIAAVILSLVGLATTLGWAVTSFVVTEFAFFWLAKSEFFETTLATINSLSQATWGIFIPAHVVLTVGKLAMLSCFFSIGVILCLIFICCVDIIRQTQEKRIKGWIYLYNFERKIEAATSRY